MRGADVDFQLEYVYLIYDKKNRNNKNKLYKYNSNNKKKRIIGDRLDYAKLHYFSELTRL